MESPTLIRLSDGQVIRRKILICVLLLLCVTSHWCQNKAATWIQAWTAPIPSRRYSHNPHSPSFFFHFVYVHLWLTVTRLPKVRDHGMFQKTAGRRDFHGRRPVNAGKFEASSESSVFMFILTATVGRNLFCLDQCDTVSSSHRRKALPRTR